MIRGATLDPATLVAPARFPEHGVDLPTGMPEALLREIGAAMARVAAGDEARHVITLTGMPMGPVDRQVLADTLGRGEVRAEIAVLKGTAASFILAERRQPIYASQRRILQELCDALVRIGPEALDRAYADDWAQAPDDAARARVVVDQVSSLTDRGAFAWHERHVGD